MIHELRRQETNTTIDTYYHNNKKRARPHASDAVRVDIVEKLEDVLHEIREGKKSKWRRTVIGPAPLFTRTGNDEIN